jgi:hypothetical protein
LTADRALPRMGAVTHLILMCGLPGSGKTTRALGLAANLPALRLCPDDWMEALGFHINDEQARDRPELMQWDQPWQLLMLGTNVIIENGLGQVTGRRGASESPGARRGRTNSERSPDTKPWSRSGQIRCAVKTFVVDKTSACRLVDVY